LAVLRDGRLVVWTDEWRAGIKVAVKVMRMVVRRVLSMVVAKDNSMVPKMV
jgi:hypothetical protein